MSKAFNKLTKAFAAVLVLVMILAMGVNVLAATSDFDKYKKGSLTIDPKYDGNVIEGGTFEIYKVADVVDNAPTYQIASEFAPAAVDFSQLGTAEAQLAAVNELDKCTTYATPVETLDRANSNKSGALTAGVYLVVQKTAPADYIVAQSFLVFIPWNNTDGSGWVYDMTVNPKMGYEAPEESESPSPSPSQTPTPTPTHWYPDYDNVQVSVVKEWDDAGASYARPDQIKVALYQDGRLYDVVTLDGDNGWKYSWGGLSRNVTWTVDELEVPDGYYSTVRKSGNDFRITNVRNGGYAPQTGMTQWPIPVLLALGVLLIVAALLVGGKKEKARKG